MTGLEFVQGLVDGTLPLNTIAETLGYDITQAEIGRVIITAEPNDTHLNPGATVHGGFSATLLDSCMGLAILSTLKRGLARPRSNSRFRSFGPSPPTPALLRQNVSCSAVVVALAPPKDGSPIAGVACSSTARRLA
jgi:hypothetical protein